MNARRGAFGPGIEIEAGIEGEAAEILAPEALAFVAFLQRGFRSRHAEILQAREQRQTDCDRGIMPTFLPNTAQVRADTQWQVASPHTGPRPRRIELIGPADTTSIAAGLAAGADTYIADFEDATVPTWNNILCGHINLRAAVGRQLGSAPGGGPAGCNVLPGVALRPRSWLRFEEHVLIDGAPCAAAIFDLALFLFHNFHQTPDGGGAPCVYIAKLDSHLEARLWNDVFSLAQDELRIPRGTLQAVCDIETPGAAFELDEILYELREHAICLHAGGAGYVSAVLRAQRTRRDLHLPGDSITAARMRCVHALRRLVAESCRRRGAQTSAGTPPILPIGTDTAANEAASRPFATMAALLASEGCDRVRVVHPGLIELAKVKFKAPGGDPASAPGIGAGSNPNSAGLLDLGQDAPVTAGDLRRNCEVALRYLDSWHAGTGWASVFNRIEDASTFDCVFALIWHRQRSSVANLADGRRVDAALVRRAIAAALKTILAERGHEPVDRARWTRAAAMLERMCGQEGLVEARNMIASPDLP